MLELPSMKEILLEEHLVMILWSLMVTYKKHDAQIPLNDMIDIYPLNIRSQDPMVLELI